MDLRQINVGRVLHNDLNFEPYKIQIVREPKQTNYIARLEFCEKMMEKINGNFIDSLLMSDEARFHINGRVNKHNSRYWSFRNPRDLHKRPLHSPKVTVWCVLSTHGVIGPYLFEDERENLTTVT